MMKYFYLCLLLGPLFLGQIQAQFQPALALDAGGQYQLKGGLTLANQAWNGFERNALPSYHFALSLETAGEWKEKNRRSIFGMQLGYYRRGSAVRIQYQDPSNPSQVIRDRLAYPFHNLGLMVTAKGQHLTGPNLGLHYGLGLRAEYTIKYQSPFINFDNYVNRFNYGLWLGGGLQWALGKSPLALVLELSISPDLSRQIYVPAGIPIQYTDNSGNVQSFPSQEQKVTNLCFEVSIGLAFIRPRYVYEEEEL